MQPAMVHDPLNDKMLAWKPEWAQSYRQYANDHIADVIEWDGLLRNGWSGGEVIEF
jgi:hypothetical protein